MSTSPFLDAAIPLPAPPEARYIWATVTQVGPLRIQVDGDQTPLGITPDCLVADLDVGRRVYCQIVNRRLVVLGVSGGTSASGGDTYYLSETVGVPQFCFAFPSDDAPDGCLWLEGQAVSRTTYPELFAAYTRNMDAATISIASPGVVTKTAHGLAAGQKVYFTTTGALPTGLVANTLYFVIWSSANTFALASTFANAVAGTAITTSGSQSGTHTLWVTAGGPGNGSTTFELPDMRGQVPVGFKASSTRFGYGPGNLVGGETHTHGTSTLIAGVWAGFWKTRVGATWVATNSGGVTAPGGSSSTSNSGPSIEGNTDASSSVQPSIIGRWYVRATPVILAPAGSTAAVPATPGTVALRDSAGRTQVSTPIDLADAANKQYVDAKYPRTCIPSSIVVTGGGTATVAADGTINFSGVSTLSLNGIFDGVGMDTYEVTVYATTSVGTSANYRLRAGGVDTATGYNRVVVYTNLTSGPTRGSGTGLADTCAMLPTSAGGSAIFNGRTTFQNPGRSTLTVMQHRAWSTANADRWLWDETGDGAGTAHDGLTLRVAAGTITGSIFIRKIA